MEIWTFFQWISSSVSSSSFGSPSLVSVICFCRWIALYLEKKLFICCAVFHSSGCKKRLPSSSFSNFISPATARGSALLQLISPVWNLLIKNAFTLSPIRFLVFGSFQNPPHNSIGCSEFNIRFFWWNGTSRGLVTAVLIPVSLFVHFFWLDRKEISTLILWFACLYPCVLGPLVQTWMLRRKYSRCRRRFLLGSYLQWYW